MPPRRSCCPLASVERAFYDTVRESDDDLVRVIAFLVDDAAVTSREEGLALREDFAAASPSPLCEAWASSSLPGVRSGRSCSSRLGA